jgi:23S rRNA pseudouridine1911/1915/1917 synthase
VLYEDDVLLAVDKPPGMVVHPSYKQSSGTLLNAVLAHLPASRGEPGIITRLDKHTSGIVLIATAPGVHRQVQDDAHNGRVVKEYLALVDGMLTPRHGVIDVPLGRDVADRRRIVPAAGGVTAITRYDVLSTDSRRSLVRCELVTGRTHQIRAHLTARGCPIVGDAVYGNRDGVLGDRQALHAWRLTLPHPLTREPLVLVAAPPHDMRTAGAGLFDALSGASS